MALVTTYSRYLSEPTLPGAIVALERAVGRLTDLLAIAEEEAGQARAPGKWSRKEVLGHLVDSAGSNLQRFVGAQITAHLDGGVLRIASYAQDDWVRVQAFGARAWRDLLALWVALNGHILHVLERVDHARLRTPCAIGAAQPVSLEHVIVDYAGHVLHHLAQILGG